MITAEHMTLISSIFNCVQCWESYYGTVL